MSKGLFDLLFDAIFDEEWKGTRGEELTERELDKLDFFGRHGEMLRNVYIPKKNGETTEIDLMYITQKGIFVFESKNYSGWIFGDENSLYWTASLANGQKNRFYNPIKQNRTHLKWLAIYIGASIPLFSIIAFSERCELKRVPLDCANAWVIKRDDTYSTVRDIWENAPDVLSDDEIENLYQRLKKLTDVDAATKLAHVETINKRIISAEEDNICPRCGKKLVIRAAKNGPNAGKQFYGCLGFPNCRYTKNYSE